MIGWISSVLAALTVALAFVYAFLKPQTDGLLGGNEMAAPAILLLIVLLAFVIGRKAPKWSAARHVSDWSAMIAAFFVVLLNIHQLPAMPGAPAAAPAVARSQEETPPADGGRTTPAVAAPRKAAPRKAAPAEPALRPGIEDDGTIVYGSRQEAMEAPGGPGDPVRIIVRDREGNEYPYFLNPGESLPGDLVNVENLAKGAWTEIRSNRRGHFIVRAEINNTPVVALIDTGASAVALSAEDAERIGLRAFALNYSVPVHTANGVVKAAPVVLRRIEIDNVLVRDVKAWVMPKGAMRGTLLGMSFLSRLSGFSVDGGKLTLKQ